MATSSNNVWVQAGYVEDGYYAPVVTAPFVPAVITLGAPGAAENLLPFKALGGSIADLDVLYGILGAEAFLEDIQTIFAIATRDGLLRAFGYEIPRPEIQAAVIECYATLQSVEDIVIEANPASTNLFGSVALTTRPVSSVTIGNEDGYWSQLAMRELLMNAPAGLWVDLAHQVVMPVLVGTILGIDEQEGHVVIRYGFSTRARKAPTVRD